jgi:anti-sigma-K factor RskA
VRHARATEELRELASLYALGSLTQHEARSFEIHLKEGCPICESECRRFERTVATIGMAAEEATPPEYIRDLLSARIERESQAATPKTQPSPEIPEKTMHEFVRPSPPSYLLSQPRNDRSNIFPWVLVVILLILGLGVVYAWKSARETNTQLEAKISSAKTDFQDLQTRLEDQKENSGNLKRILGTLGKPGTRIARLVVQATPPTHSAAVVWDTEKSNCLVLGNFPEAPEGKVYQLWFFTPLAKISAGPFRAASKGIATLPVPRDAANASAAVITLEPDNGSQIPTSPYYAAGRID